MEITDYTQEQIKAIWNKHIHEGVSGRFFCTNSGLKRIAKAIGMDYNIMGKQRRNNFRSDVIGGYQIGFFTKNQEY